MIKIFSAAIFAAILDGAFMTIFGLGIYSFSHSIVWAVIGGFIGHKNPILGLIAYLAIEYFFNNNHLTIYSALLAVITVTQVLFANSIAKKSKINK